MGLAKNKTQMKRKNTLPIEQSRSAANRADSKIFRRSAPCAPTELGRLVHNNVIHDNFKENFFHELHVLLQDKLFVDLTLISTDLKRFDVHRIVLSSNSKHLKEHFRKNNLTELRVRAKGDILKEVLNYCYTGEIELNEDNATLVFELACIWQLNDLADTCARFLVKNISADNCINILRMHTNNSLRLCNRMAIQYFEKNFMTIAQQENFKSFTAMELKILLESDNLNVTSEEAVFDAFLLWLNRFPEYKNDLALTADRILEKDNNIRYLLGVIRLPQMSPEYFISKVEKVCQYFERVDLIIEFYKWKALKSSAGQIKNDIANKRMIPRNQSSLRLVICGWPESNGINELRLEMLDKGGMEWTQLPPLLIDKQEHSCLILYDQVQIIILGGVNSSLTLNTVKRINLVTMEVVSLLPMKHARSQHAGAVLERDIYVAGGRSKKAVLNFVEKWNHKKSIWEILTPLLYARYFHKLVAANGLLYAIGGRNKTTAFRTVECYDPETNTWKLKAPMNRPRIDAGAAVLGRFIYMIGGCQNTRGDALECEDTETVERYDIEANVWTLIASIRTPRNHVSASILNNSIYAIGGYDPEGETIKEVERYDEETKKWYPVPSINLNDACCAFVTTKAIENLLQM